MAPATLLAGTVPPTGEEEKLVGSGVRPDGRELSTGKGFHPEAVSPVSASSPWNWDSQHPAPGTGTKTPDT